MYLNKDAILNSLTKEDVIKVVTSLGSATPKTDSQGNLIFQTVCHGSTSWKLYYYHEPDIEKDFKGQAFKCYTQCGDCFNIVELVIRANRVKGKTVTWYKALYYIAQLTGKIYTSSTEEIEEQQRCITDFEWINRLKAVKKKKRDVPTNKAIDEHILEMFYYAPHEDWLNEHISREALSRFEIGYYGLTNQITIPHRDKDERLIGIRGRFLDEEDVKRFGKYVPIRMLDDTFLSHKLGTNLYGLNVVQNKIKSCKKVMIVEAEKSCMQAYSYFGEDSFVVAVCGSAISSTHIKIILQYLEVEEVIIGFDRQYHEADSFEATIWWNKILKEVAPLVPYVKVYVLADREHRLEYKDSPTDKGKEILLQLMKEKIEITMDDIKQLDNKGKNMEEE